METEMPKLSDDVIIAILSIEDLLNGNNVEEFAINLRAKKTVFEDLLPKIQELESECFKLAAYHCENPYAGEGGSMGCKVVDYWRERCRLADKIIGESKLEFPQSKVFYGAQSAYNKFIKENKQP